MALSSVDPRLAPGYVHVDAHPDHGQPVIYTPGEALPDFVLEALAAGGTLAVEGPGVFRLVLAGRPKPEGAARRGGSEKR